MKNDRIKKLIDKKSLKSIVSFSSSQIDRMEKSGNFPRRIKISPNRVAWLEDDIQEWISAKAAPPVARR